jgi:hypothetical protein
MPEFSLSYRRIAIEPFALTNPTIAEIKCGESRDEYKAKGKRVEDDVVKWLTAAGFHVAKRQHKHRITVCKLLIFGAIDGVVMVDGMPCLLEIKSRCVFRSQLNGVSEADIIQMMLYMRMAKLPKCLFVEEHLGSLSASLIEYNEVFTNKVLISLSTLLEAPQPISQLGRF